MVLWKKWKRIFRDVWGQATEQMNKNDKQLREEACIETDADAGVTIDAYESLVKKRKLAPL